MYSLYTCTHRCTPPLSDAPRVSRSLGAGPLSAGLLLTPLAPSSTLPGTENLKLYGFGPSLLGKRRGFAVGISIYWRFSPPPIPSARCLGWVWGFKMLFYSPPNGGGEVLRVLLRVQLLLLPAVDPAILLRPGLWALEWAGGHSWS